MTGHDQFATRSVNESEADGAAGDLDGWFTDLPPPQVDAPTQPSPASDPQIVHPDVSQRRPAPIQDRVAGEGEQRRDGESDPRRARRWPLRVSLALARSRRVGRCCRATRREPLCGTGAPRLVQVGACRAGRRLRCVHASYTRRDTGLQPSRRIGLLSRSSMAVQVSNLRPWD